MSQVNELRSAINTQDALAQALRAAAVEAQTEADEISDQDSIQAAIAWAKVFGLEQAAAAASKTVIDLVNELRDIQDPEGLRAEAL